MEDTILAILSAGVTELSEIALKANLSKKNTRQILEDLVERLLVVQTGKERFGILKTGTIEVKALGYGFIDVADEEEDYYVKASELNFIFDGDTVLFYPYDDGSKLLNAHILRVTERGHHFMIGKYQKRTRKGKMKEFIESTNARFSARAVVKRGPKDIEDGMIVYASIEYVGTAIEASILEVLGHPDDPGIEITQIALEYGFRTEFPEEVANELLTIPTEVSNEETVERRDFRNNLIFTIDGTDSKDFDDAVSLEINEDGSFTLGVYIADVTHYVKENSFLDQEALKRGTSVYLADRVIPMLPHKLSNGICSLNEGVDRLVLACIMTISKTGNLTNYEIVEGVICSRHRMTYSDVNLILKDDATTCSKYKDLVPMLKNMQKLSHIIRSRRVKKGGLEFRVPEYQFLLNKDGSPAQIIPREKKEAEDLIEDFMLMANETVAYHLNIMNLPCIYRIHEKPDQDKLAQVITQLSYMGAAIDTSKNVITPKIIQQILAKLVDTPIELVGHQLLLRSMKKAKYDDVCLGHYGLAMNYYCHFTSPIRRYPDLMVHRILKHLCLHPEAFEDDLTHFEGIVGEISLKNSKSERDSVDCERAVDDMLAAWYMEQYIGKTFQGKISSLTPSGIYVRLDNGIEGYVSLSSLHGFYDYDSESMSYIGPQYRYSMGQSVDIVVIGADRKSRKIDFMMLNDYEEEQDENSLYK